MSPLSDVGADDETLGPSLKNISASSSTTKAPVSKKKRLDQTLNCPHCSYRTNQPTNLHRHLLLHKIKSNYSCPLCSYSALRLGGITRHLNRHHPEENTAENKTALPKSTTQAEKSSSSSPYESEKWYYDRNGRRFRYLLCDACPYKTKIRSRLEDHIKTAHPSSTPAMLHCGICEFKTRDKVAFQVHGMRHQEKSVYKCNRCSFSVPHPNVLENHMTHHHSNKRKMAQKNAAVPDKEEWYYAPGGGRMRYKFCNHCHYKTPVRFSFQQHMKNRHPFSKSELPTPLPRKNKAILRRCTDCPFETWFKRRLEKHMTYHEKKSTHPCHVCGLLLGNRARLSLHLKRNHPNQDETDREGHQDQNEGDQEENQINNIEMAEPTTFPVPKQKKSRTRVPLKTRQSSFGRKRANAERKERSIKANLALRECRVVLVDMFSNCCFDPEFIEATENRVRKEEEEKLQKMRMQVGILTEKARNADEEVREILINKTDLKKMIKKIEGRKAKLEETIRAVQVQVNESENELFALRELDESFSKDLENANKAAVGASEALCALQLELELEGLKSNNSL